MERAYKVQVRVAWCICSLSAERLKQATKNANVGPMR
jgi:hypothetical protein